MDVRVLAFVELDVGLVLVRNVFKPFRFVGLNFVHHHVLLVSVGDLELLDLLLLLLAHLVRSLRAGHARRVHSSRRRVRRDLRLLRRRRLQRRAHPQLRRRGKARLALQRRVYHEALLVHAQRRSSLDLNAAALLALVREIVGAAVVSDGRVVGDLVASDDGVDDPLETLFALDHLDQELPLKNLVLFLDVEFEFLVAAADLRDDVVRLHFHVNLVDADQVQRALDPNNWYRDDHLVDHALELEIDLGAFPRDELHRRLHEKSLDDLLNLALRHAAEVHFADHVVLVIGVFLQFEQPRRLDLLDLLELVVLEGAQFGVELRLAVVANGDESLPLLLFEGSSLSVPLFILQQFPPPLLFQLLLLSQSFFFQSFRSFSLSCQFCFSLSRLGIPQLFQSEFFFSGQRLESPSFLLLCLPSCLFLFPAVTLLLKEIQLELFVSLKAKIDGSRIGRCTLVAHLDRLDHFLRILPVLRLQIEAEIEGGQ